MLSTAQKIGLAKAAFHCVALWRKFRHLPLTLNTTRGGILWSLDLREGIDLSIYLLGGFEPQTLKLYRSLIQPGDVVLDIGANIGSHTLPLAKLVGNNGVVIAFEPTRYAFTKLEQNLAFNPQFSKSVMLRQSLLVTDVTREIPDGLYSSWPLEGDDLLHQEHKGREMDTHGARAEVLDDVVKLLGLKRIDFIKLDVDGFEPEVIGGSTSTLRTYHPTILMELAPYLFQDNFEEFQAMIEVLCELGYSLHDANTGKPYPMDAVKLTQMIPNGISRNVVARINIYQSNEV